MSYGNYPSNQLPLQFNQTIVSGTTFTNSFTWTSGSVGGPYTPVNLSGYSADMKVKDSNNNLIVELSTSNSLITLGGSAGTILLTLSNTATTAISAGTYQYDLVLTSGAGVVTALLYGSIVVYQSISV